MATNCSALSTYPNFPTYVDRLRNATANDLSIDGMRPCRSEICSTLLGVGKADISGIGVSIQCAVYVWTRLTAQVVVAYTMHLILGALLPSMLMILDSMPRRHRLRSVIQKSYLRYSDSAIMLAFSIQVAAVVLLAKKNFGFSASDFGDLTIELTSAAALITILPITTLCSFPAGSDAGIEVEYRILTTFWTTTAGVLFLFTFISRMLSTYASGQIGSGPDAVLTIREAANIEKLCYLSISGQSKVEKTAFQVFSLIGSLVALLSIITNFLGTLRRTLGLTAPEKSSAIDGTQQPSKKGWFLKIRRTIQRKFLLSNVLVWGSLQLVLIFRLRHIQHALAASINEADNDDAWSFGQIIAVVVFLPVFVQLGYDYGTETCRSFLGSNQSLHELEGSRESNYSGGQQK
jgi:hypothetical protein